MKKTVLTFGLISGAVSSLMMICTVPFLDSLGHGNGAEVLGYTTIVLSFLLVFFGVRAHREQAGGTLTFWSGLQVGLLITLISCTCYVITWEILSHTVMSDFAEKYSAHIIEHARASGASQQVIDNTIQQMQDFKKMYANPLYNVAITFMEPLPIGLGIALISAVVLRKK
jgi:hypothetical protein